MEVLMKLFDAIVRFDNLVLGRIEKFCHKTQRTIGWTCFTWLRVACALFGLLFGAMGIYDEELLLAHSMPLEEKMFSLGLFTVLFGLGGSVLATVLEKLVNTHLKNRVANPAKADSLIVVFRTSLMVSILVTPIVVAGFYSFTGTIILYLMQCDPLPPCDSKLKQWFQSLFLTPAPIRIGK